MNFKMVKSYAMQSSPYPYRILSNCLNTKPITKPAESRIYIYQLVHTRCVSCVYSCFTKENFHGTDQLKDEK